MKSKISCKTPFNLTAPLFVEIPVSYTFEEEHFIPTFVNRSYVFCTFAKVLNLKIKWGPRITNFPITKKIGSANRKFKNYPFPGAGKQI